MSKTYHIRTITHATFEGGQWEQITNNAGELLGFRARGTDCALYIGTPDLLEERFSIPLNELVMVEGCLAVVPQADDPEETAH